MSWRGARVFFEAGDQGYVLRVPPDFRVTLARGVKLTCAEAVSRLLKDERRRETRSAGKGSKGDRWYARAWTGTASLRHYLLVRRHLKTGELAFHYCYVPAGQSVTLTRLVRAAGLRWPAEEDFEFGKDRFGLDSPRSGSIPRSPGTPCWSWPRWRSAPSPPPCSATAPTAASPAGPGTTPRSRHAPADRPGDQAPARRRPGEAIPTWPRGALVRPDPPPPGPITLVPPARKTRQKHRDRPRQLAKCGCRTGNQIPGPPFSVPAIPELAAYPDRTYSRW